MGTQEKVVAKPGDTIEIIDSGNAYFGEQFTVIEFPLKYKNTKFDTGQPDAWVLYDGGNYGRFVFDSYVVCEQSGMQDTKRDDIDTDESLRRQLNDNLRSVFG